MENKERKQSMENEEGKLASRRGPYTHLEQVHSDYATAMVLQEQERAFAILTTIESDSNEEESDEASSTDSNDQDGNDYEFFQSHEFESDMEFQPDSDSDEDMDEEDDDIDLDELSYEELIALGEFIGHEKRGLAINEISTCLNPCKYRSLATKTGTDRCVICQVEFGEDESLVALSCDHPYHSECITRWLQINKICPICSTEVSSPKNISTTD
ncbi:RING/U-BOX SUPERFAMILY PROTEIN [Salix purpurea]|uniref:RING/U-BOX SUPERFAMILY PROTEIN n=1 Tax=Salix purpurea TaxID=77065 RepID=A0A9Q1AK11_SALPP|nr:RING/U-BOX SUPERFAMILY PROTEIN [Salix purpurea]